MDEFEKLEGGLKKMYDVSLTHLHSSYRLDHV